MPAFTLNTDVADFFIFLITLGFISLALVLALDEWRFTHVRHFAYLAAGFVGFWVLGAFETVEAGLLAFMGYHIPPPFPPIFHNAVETASVLLLGYALVYAFLVGEPRRALRWGYTLIATVLLATTVVGLAGYALGWQWEAMKFHHHWASPITEGGLLLFFVGMFLAGRYVTINRRAILLASVLFILKHLLTLIVMFYPTVESLELKFFEMSLPGLAFALFARSIYHFIQSERFRALNEYRHLAARLEDTVRERTAELEVQLRRTAALLESGLALSSTLDLKQVLDHVTQLMVSSLHVDGCAIFNWDEQANTLTVLAVAEHSPADESSGPVKGAVYDVNYCPPAAEALQTKQPVVVHLNDPTIGQRECTLLQEGNYQAMLAVPMMVKGHAIGVVELYSTQEGRRFNDDDVAMALGLAGQAAIAIENAWLHEELKASIEELQRAQTQLIQSAKLAAIGELAAGVAHELNNPLTSVLGFASLALEETEADDPRLHPLQVVQKEALRARGIIRSLLDFARQSRPRMSPEDLNALLQQTVELVNHSAQKKQVHIKEQYDALPPVWVDADQMRQVFLNLINNAVQAMPQGGELVITSRLMNSNGEQQQVSVSFRDTGKGIPPEVLPRIFEPFFTTKAEGTGLGLSVSYGIVERHRGRIEVESMIGIGSTFTVILPVLAAEEQL